MFLLRLHPALLAILVVLVLVAIRVLRDRGGLKLKMPKLKRPQRRPPAKVLPMPIKEPERPPPGMLASGVPAGPSGLPEDVKLADDTLPALWLEASIANWTSRFGRVGATMPEGFEAYTRVLHPAYWRAPDGSLETVPWRTVAARLGSTIERGIRIHEIGAAPDASPLRQLSWGQRPTSGTLDRAEAKALAEVLRAHTTTPDRIWFAIWNGFGALDHEYLAGAPTMHIPQRDLVLLCGPIDAVPRFVLWGMWQTPNLWWPDDRAWCVATEIDAYSTYIGGTAACIEAVNASDALETIDVRLDERIG